MTESATALSLHEIRDVPEAAVRDFQHKGHARLAGLDPPASVHVRTLTAEERPS